VKFTRAVYLQYKEIALQHAVR